MQNQQNDYQLGHTDIAWEQRHFPLIVACDNWQDPRNVGMAFRLCESFGVQELWLGGNTPSPPNRKLSKTARSTVERVTFRQVADLAEALVVAKAAGYITVGIEITKHSQSLRQLAKACSEQRCVLVLGAESAGIDAMVVPLLDHCAHITMYGRNTSLNVATALGIALFAWTDTLR